MTSNNDNEFLDAFNESEDFPYPTTISRQDFQNDNQKDNFNVDEFLYKNHRFTSIDILIKDLTNLSKSLNQDLLDLVNNDYNDFIELGKSINGGLDLINNIKIDLKKFNFELNETKATFTNSSTIIKNGLIEKKKLINLKTKIKLLLLLNDQINNFEILLNSEDDNEIEIKIIIKLKNLTSLYLSFTKLNSLLINDSINFIEKNLKLRILSLKFEFKAYLEELLLKSLQQSKNYSNDKNNNDLVLQLLNIYKITGHESEFLSIIKRKQ